MPQQDTVSIWGSNYKRQDFPLSLLRTALAATRWQPQGLCPLSPSSGHTEPRVAVSVGGTGCLWQSQSVCTQWLWMWILYYISCLCHDMEEAGSTEQGSSGLEILRCSTFTFHFLHSKPKALKSVSATPSEISTFLSGLSPLNNGYLLPLCVCSIIMKSYIPSNLTESWKTFP